MRHKFKAIWFAIMALLVWGGVGGNTSALAATATSQLTEPIIEHMQVITKTLNTVEYVERWHNLMNGNTRFDNMQYDLNANTTKFTRSMAVEGGKRKYLLKQVNGQWTGETWLSKTYAIPNQSLFNSESQRYKSNGWVAMGNVTFNGKQVKKVKFTEGSPNMKTTTIAYLDTQTGLPVKEELYNNNDPKPFAVSIYLFDRVNDPTAIFKEFSGATIKEVAKPSF